MVKILSKIGIMVKILSKKSIWSKSLLKKEEWSKSLAKKSIWGFFFKGGGALGQFFKNWHIFTYTCPNGSGVGAIDRSDRAEHVFNPYSTLEVLRKFFMAMVETIRAEKPSKNGLFWPFIRVLCIKPL